MAQRVDEDNAKLVARMKNWIEKVVVLVPYVYELIVIL
jgi:hypothetical protein